MDNKVLLLNVDDKPISAISIKKAFLMTHLGKADVIYNYDNKKIKTINKVYKYPSVIKLKKYVNIYSKLTIPLTRTNLLKRDGHKCSYCGSKKRLTIDHVLPKSKGGKSTWDNLAIACHTCNNKKANKTPIEANMVLKTTLIKPSHYDFITAMCLNEKNKYWEYFLK